MDQRLLEELKKKLLAEKKLLEEDLSGIAHRSKAQKNDWEVEAPDMGSNDASREPDDMADTFEEMENVASREAPLEGRLHEVEAALERMASGNYGSCKSCGKPIPEERLKANPAALYDMEHAG